MKKEKRKTSLFFRVFWGILAIVAFSNWLFAFILWNGYEQIISQIRPFLSPQTFKEVEVNIFNTWIMGASSFIFVIILVTLFAIFFVSRLVKPIFELVKAAKEIEAGNFKIRPQIKTKDEIGELAEAFVHMAKTLEENKEILEDEKKVLEIRVKARTKALEELAQSLDEKVKERTKELQERIEELEKFHRLSIGREMKLIELKNKVSQLEEELNKYKEKYG